jgi:hypothetical protein
MSSGTHVVGQVARDRELAAVERRVAQADDAVAGLEPQRARSCGRGCTRCTRPSRDLHRETTSRRRGQLRAELVPAITSNRPGSTIALHVSIDQREFRGAEHEGDRLAFARRQRDALESAQLLRRTRAPS